MRRVSSAVWKRLERLEQAKKARKCIGAWPDIIYDCDEWTALAVPMQERLSRGLTEELYRAGKDYNA